MLTAFFASRMEVFFLERSWGSHAVGLFTVSLTLANLATQGPLLLTGALLPRLSGHIGRDEEAEARQVYATSVSLMGLLVFPACLGMAAIAPVLLPLMYGRDFDAAVPTATILLAASALVATASVAAVYLIAVERTRFLLAAAVAGAALSILAGLTIVPSLADAQGPISSTRIRRFLQDGYPERAAADLGRSWSIRGEVAHGDKRGRTIGFPTANVALGRHLEPARGVYAVMVRLSDGATHRGVANIGRRPTVADGMQSRLEVHLFDFDSDLYGQEISVALHAFLRAEEKFANFEALRAQISVDADNARAVLDRALLPIV